MSLNILRNGKGIETFIFKPKRKITHFACFTIKSVITISQMICKCMVNFILEKLVKLDK